MRSRSAAVALFAGLVVMALPAAAPAATKVVSLGVPPSSQKSFQKLKVDVNAFFPGSVTIAVGDRVRFVPAGFHNADIPPKGGKPLGFISPQGPIAGANDPAGAAYWFNGQPNFGITPDLVKQGFGKSLTYDGTKRVDSGLPLADKPKPMTVKFTKAGSFTFFCSIHQGMKGTVKVLRKGSKVSSVAADKLRVAGQVLAALKRAKVAAATKPTGNVIDVGVAGKGGVEYFDFAPKSLTVSRGTTVRFRMTPGSYEAHTATAGPGDPESQPTSFLGKLTASIESPTIDPQALYPSDAPGQVPSISPTSHGNGFWNSGFLDVNSASPLPDASSVRFDTPGTYRFVCLIHPFMKGSVTVQ